MSTLNYVTGETVANAAIVPLGPGGLTVVAGVSGTDLILDVDGYFRDALVHGVDSNLFVGVRAGVNNTGGANTAVGTDALGVSSSGSNNTAVGVFALQNTTTAGGTAVGASALRAHTTGNFNTAVGIGALAFLQAGSGNTALGAAAGGSLVTGDDNIYIGNPGATTYIAGILDKTVDLNTAQLVRIDASGKLGTITVASTRRVKTDIEDIGERSARLHVLRPVSFHYRAQPDGPLEYGLIAEEVAEVYPELAIRDGEGAPVNVRYHLLPALLLNELQRQARALAARDAELQTARAELAELKGTVAAIMAELARLTGRRPAAVERHERSW